MTLILGWCKSSCGFALLNFAIRYWSTFLNKCDYVGHHFNVHFSLYAFLLTYYLLFIFTLDYRNYSPPKKKKTVTDFIFLGSKITVNGDCSHEIKRHLFLGRKATTNLDSVLKNRDITLLTKVRLVKTMVFPAVMYGCESWTIKKAEHWGTDAFKDGEDSWESLR